MYLREKYLNSLKKSVDCYLVGPKKIGLNENKLESLSKNNNKNKALENFGRKVYDLGKSKMMVKVS